MSKRKYRAGRKFDGIDDMFRSLKECECVYYTTSNRALNSSFVVGLPIGFVRSAIALGYIVEADKIGGAE